MWEETGEVRVQRSCFHRGLMVQLAWFPDINCSFFLLDLHGGRTEQGHYLDTFFKQTLSGNQGLFLWEHSVWDWSEGVEYRQVSQEKIRGSKSKRLKWEWVQRGVWNRCRQGKYEDRENGWRWKQNKEKKCCFLSLIFFCLCTVFFPSFFSVHNCHSAPAKYLWMCDNEGWERVE